MQIDQWVVAILSALIMAGSLYGLGRLIFDAFRHERESKEWMRRELKERQRQSLFKWEQTTTTTTKRTTQPRSTESQDTKDTTP